MRRVDAARLHIGVQTFDVIAQPSDVSSMTLDVSWVRLEHSMFGLQVCVLGEERLVLSVEVDLVGHLKKHNATFLPSNYRWLSASMALPT